MNNNGRKKNWCIIREKWWKERKQWSKHPYIDYHACYETWGDCEYEIKR